MRLRNLSVHVLSFRHAILALILTALFAWMSTGVSAQSSLSPMNTITVTTGQGQKAWKVDLASDGASRSKGLMFVRHMPAGTGMLFRFEVTRPVVMWMKNTYIPLDMVFLSESGEIRSIHRGAVPHSLEHIRSQEAVRYVLEINAGEADSSGLKVGQAMRHPWFGFAN